MTNGEEMFTKGLCIACVISVSSFGAEIPDQLGAVWKQFQECVKKNDIDGIIEMTYFPIKSNEFGGNIKSKAEFKKKYHQIFTPYIVQKVIYGKPERIASYRGYVVDCIDPNGYAIYLGFEKKGHKFQFSYIDNANE